jgi:hypothetical protein
VTAEGPAEELALVAGGAQSCDQAPYVPAGEEVGQVGEERPAAEVIRRRGVGERVHRDEALPLFQGVAAVAVALAARPREEAFPFEGGVEGRREAGARAELEVGGGVPDDRGKSRVYGEVGAGLFDHSRSRLSAGAGRILTGGGCRGVGAKIEGVERRAFFREDLLHLRVHARDVVRAEEPARHARLIAHHDREEPRVLRLLHPPQGFGTDAHPPGVRKIGNVLDEGAVPVEEDGASWGRIAHACPRSTRAVSRKW